MILEPPPTIINMPAAIPESTIVAAIASAFVVVWILPATKFLMLLMSL